MGERAFEATTEELFALSALLQLPRPAPASRPEAKDWTDEVRTAVAAFGVRSLVARGVVAQGPDGPSIPAGLRNAMEALCRPVVVAQIQRAQENAAIEAAVYAGAEHVAVHRPTGIGNHRLRLAELKQLPLVVAAITGIEGLPAEIATLDDEVFVPSARLLPDAAAGVGAEFLANDATAVSLSTGWLTEDGVIRGRELSWAVSNEGRLAMMEADLDGDPAGVHLRPSTLDELRKRVSELFPSTRDLRGEPPE